MYPIALITAFLAAAQASPLAAQLGPSTLFAEIAKPASWTATGDANPETVLKMHIGLKQNNIKGLEAKLLDVSNPQSTNYGKWLSKDELESYTKPTDETVTLVKTWLASHGIESSSSATPDWLEISVPVSKAESLLNTRYSLFTADNKNFVPGTLGYSLPELLHSHIDDIQPTNAFHLVKRAAPVAAKASISRRGGKGNGPSSCTNGVNAACIKQAYDVDYVGKGNTTMAVTGMIGLSASHSDAKQYLSTYFPAGKGRDFLDATYPSTATPNNSDNPDFEGDLDTQIALSIGHPAPATYLVLGPNQENTDFGDQLISMGQYLNSQSTPPYSISASYDGNEPEFSSNYIDRICNEFMKASSRGVSIFFSSGDQGVSGYAAKSSCPSGFVPTFPSTCPYLTSVGSTEFTSSGSSAEKVAAFNFISGGTPGGGFSNYFTAPDWQKSDTAAYVSKVSSSLKGKYNASGRGFPDVSLVGVYWNVVQNGKNILGEGTSASSPAWASLIAQVNDYRASIGKGPVGFLNQALYTNKDVRAALRDVTTGKNAGCGLSTAFQATSGWDAASGLGSVTFSALRKALGAL